MYISDTDHRSARAAKTAFVYLLISLFCVLFGAVYERFSHEVYSFYMLYGFVFPLAGGTLPFFILSFTRFKKYPASPARNLYHSGIAALTVGSFLQGVWEIYGTSQVLTGYYRIVGSVLWLAGITLYLLQCGFDKSGAADG